MSDATADESVEEEIDEPSEDDAQASGKLSRLRSMVPGGMARAAVIGVLSLVMVGGAGAYFGGLLDPLLSTEETAYKPVDVVFYDLPEMVVNLASGTKKPAYLKIHLSLELDESEDVEVLERLLPRVIDHFQVFLRELRVDNLSGSAGIYRIKKELLRRVSVAVHPVEIRDVLFREMLVQ